MEKIYEENNGQKPQRWSLSIVLSFAVALFAIVSLIVVGFNQISYAAPISGNSITLKLGMWGTNTAFINARNNNSESFMVRLMFADSNDAAAATQPVFCVEQGIEATDSASYSGDSKINDAGLIYIMNKSRVLGGDGITPTNLTYPDNTSQTLSAADQKYLEMYATQIAIWMYLYEKYPSGNSLHGKLEVPQTDGEGNPRTYTPLDVIRGQVNLYLTNGSNTRIYSGPIYAEYIAPLVEAAKSAGNYKTVQAVLASENISKVGDDDIFQTDKITVVANPSSDLVNYSVDLSGIDGAYVVDKDGNTKSSLDTFAPTDYFYIRVPVNKVTNDSKFVNVSIVGEFQNYIGGEYFVATNSQQIIGVTSEHYRVANDMKINFLISEDTGMSAAQTIYFIGLIVLLCGVGIIYANAKPVEQK